MIEKILMATSHQGKVEEVQSILSIPVEITSVEIDEVQSMDLEHVARKKAEEAFRILGKPVIVDDVGVFIEAWNGFPGPFVKHILEIVGKPKILELLKYEDNRKATVTSAIGYHDGKNVYVFLGEVKGVIVSEERGTEGYGFDSMFIPDGQELTYAEMGLSGKNELSHRRRALDKLKEHLDSQSK